MGVAKVAPSGRRAADDDGPPAPSARVAQRVAHLGRRRRNVGLEAVEQVAPSRAACGSPRGRARGRRARRRPRRRRRPGPEQQLVVAGRQLGGGAVALAGLVVAALADEVVALAGQRVGVAEVEQAVELVQRLGVVVDAQVDGPPPRLARGAARRRAPPTGDRGRRRPRASAACSAASRRRASGPLAASNACAIAGHTSGEAIMLACALKPCAGLVTGIVDAAARRCGSATSPWASTTATWRTAARSSAATSASSAAAARVAALEAVERARPVGRLDDRLGRDGADARHAPTARSAPTANQCDCTAAPSSPGLGVAGDDRVRPVRSDASYRRHAEAYAPACTRRSSRASARSRRASCAPTATSRPARRATPGAVLLACDDATVPWHRVVRADGSLAKGARQRALLEAEGVPFRGATASTWRGTIARRCGSSVRSPSSRARAAFTWSPTRCVDALPELRDSRSGSATCSSATRRRR